MRSAWPENLLRVKGLIAKAFCTDGRGESRDPAPVRRWRYDAFALGTGFHDAVDLDASDGPNGRAAGKGEMTLAGGCQGTSVVRQTVLRPCGTGVPSGEIWEEESDGEA